jgi:hypothetical protein
MEERQEAIQLQTGYNQGEKTGSCAAAERIHTERKGTKLCSCREDKSREKRQEAVQLQTGYNQGGKTRSCAAADRIQAGRKDREYAAAERI